MSVGHEPRLDPVRGASLASRLVALPDIALAAWAGDELDLLRQAGEAALQALDVASASISKWEPQSGRIRTLLNLGDLGPGEVPEPVDETYDPETHPHLRLLAEQLSPWSCSVDDMGAENADLELLRRLGKHCSLGAPIPLDGRIWGELFLTRTADQPCFDEADAAFALVVAAQVGAALATAAHLDHVDRVAHTDPLTGLGNRLAVDEALDIAISRHRSEQITVSLVICDLNGLKRINDEQGHDFGDRALVRFAGLLDAVTADLPGALAARLGGDEFCLVAADVPADDVIAAAEDLCRRVLRSPLEGVSCGVASTADDVGLVDTAGRLFRLADAAQYRAKRSRATVPIVAGRALPAEVVSHAAAVTSMGSGDRRMFRGRDLSDTARLLRGGLQILDDARDQGAEDRLVLVAEHLAEHCQPLGWWISRADVGRGTVQSVRHAIVRDHSRPGDQISADIGNEYRLDEYPQTAYALRGHVVALHASDPETDPAELAMLDGMGATTLLMAGVTDPFGQSWLVELIGDAMSLSMADLVVPLRVLMAVAVLEAHEPAVR